MKIAAMAVLGMLGCGTGFAQSDSATLQAILAELRTMHNDVRVSQTTQILLTELVMEHAAVEKATEKRDTAHNRESQLQMSEKSIAAQIAQMEDNPASGLDQAQQTRMTQQQQTLKMALTNMKDQEGDAESALLDAENALRKEQQTLDGIQEQLNDAVKQLQPGK